MTEVRVIANEEIIPPPIEYLPRQNRNGTVNGHHEHADPGVERQLISAALTAPGVVDVVAATGLRPEHFTATHQTLWSAIVTVTEQGGRPDPALVLAAAQADHAAIDEHELVELASSTVGYLSNATSYATVIIKHANTRAARTALERASEAVRLGADPHAVLAGLGDALPAAPNSQEPLVSDLQAVMDGNVEPVIPHVAPRDDHATCLLYAPGVNWLSGEPGEGKSMLALWWVAQVIQTGGAALYVDYEGTEQGIVARLREMGVTDVTGLDYIRVSDPWTPARLTALRQLARDKQFRIAVIDAVAGAMEAEDLDPESNRDVEKWCAFMPTMLATTGAAVVAVDHVAKNKEGRGRWMIGAQRKMARADAAFNLEMFEKAGVGVTGHGKLLVAKDRYGALAPHQAGRIIAEIVIASTVYETSGDDLHTLAVKVAPPPALGSPGNPVTSGPTWYMEQVSVLLEQGEPMGARELRAAVGRKSKYVDAAVKALAEADPAYIVKCEKRGNTQPWKSVRPYRQPLSPVTVDDVSPPSPAPSFYETGDDDPF